MNIKELDIKPKLIQGQGVYKSMYFINKAKQINEKFNYLDMRNFNLGYDKEKNIKFLDS